MHNNCKHNFEHNTALVGGGVYAGQSESLAICSPLHVSISLTVVCFKEILSVIQGIMEAYSNPDFTTVSVGNQGI